MVFRLTIVGIAICNFLISLFIEVSVRGSDNFLFIQHFSFV